MLLPLDVFEQIIEHVDLVPTSCAFQKVFPLIHGNVRFQFGVGAFTQQKLNDSEIAMFGGDGDRGLP